MANRTIVKGNIGNALHSVAPDHIVTTADEIFDETAQKYQSEINQETMLSTEGIYDVSEKNGGETFASLAALLNDNRLGTLIPTGVRKGGMSIKFIQTTPAKYTVEKTEGLTEQPTGDTEEISSDPSIASGTYEASQLSAFSTLPALLNSSLTYYLAVTETVNEQEVTTYTSWEITYAQSSDNKYVQYRYMSSSTAVADFTNVINWQGVDDDFYIGKEDLIKNKDVTDYVVNNPSITGSYKYGFKLTQLHSAGIDYLTLYVEKGKPINVKFTNVNAVFNSGTPVIALYARDLEGNVCFSKGSIHLDETTIVNNYNYSGVVRVGFYTESIATAGYINIELSGVGLTYIPNLYNKIAGCVESIACCEESISGLQNDIVTYPVVGVSNIPNTNIFDSALFGTIGNVFGKVEYDFLATIGEHSADVSTIKVNIKAGTTIKGIVGLGSASWNSASLRIIGKKDGVTVLDKVITINEQFSATLTGDIDTIGFYIYKVTTVGTFHVALEWMDINTELTNTEVEVESFRNIFNTHTLTYIITRNSEQSPDDNNIQCNIKAGNTIKGIVKLIDAKFKTQYVCAVYVKDANGIVTSKRVTPEEVFEIVSPRDATYFGLYIYGIDKTGYINLTAEIIDTQLAVDYGTEAQYSGEKIIIEPNIYYWKQMITISELGGLSDNIYKDPQGAAIVGDKYFLYGMGGSNSASGLPAGLILYDLENSEKLGEIVIPDTIDADHRYHPNSLGYLWKYDNSDALPMIIYNAHHTDGGKCLIMRINSTYDDFTLINSIVYQDFSSELQKGDWIYDEVNNYIYLVGSPLGDVSKTKYIKFKMPTLTNDGSAITLTSGDVLESFTVDSKNGAMWQQRIIVNGQFFVLDGLGTSSYPNYITLFAPEQKEIISDVSLPLSFGEPQGICIYNKDVVVCTYSKLYILHFK